MKRVVLAWLLALGSLGCALAVGYVYVSAVATASLRFGDCGPSALDAVDPYCRVGIRLLHVAYAMGSAALVLGVAALWLVWAIRRGRGARP